MRKEVGLPVLALQGPSHDATLPACKQSQPPSAAQGEDWVRNIGIPTIDLASFHFYPNNGPYEFEIAFSQVALLASFLA